MKSLKLDELWKVLPQVEELRPVLDLLLSRSVPDAEHAWTASGELETVSDRRVPGDALSGQVEALAAGVQARSVRLFQCVADALAHLAAGRRGEAGEAFLAAAELEEEGGRPGRAEAWARSALTVSRSERDQTTAALALRRCARAARAGGHLDEAGSRYREGFASARALGDSRGAAEAAIGAGNVLEDQGRWSESEDWYRRALAELDEAGEGRVPERWHALLNLHIVLRSRGRVEDSRAYLDEAEATAAGDETALAFLENARGQLLQVDGDLAGAERHFRLALDRAPGAAARAVIGANLAEALMARGRLLDAAEAAREAEMHAVSTAAVTRLPEVYRILGRIAAARGSPDAFVLFERALEIIRDRSLPSVEEARTLQAYAEAEAARGEARTARELRTRAEAIYRRLGIHYPRHPWSEYHGPPATETPQAHPERDDGDDG